MASATTAGFRPVNINLSAQDGPSTGKLTQETENTPTTPRPTARFADAERKANTPIPPNPITPTRHDFGGIPGQRALPNTPFTPSDIADARPQSKDGPVLNREDSHRSTHSHSQMSDGSGDVEMADDDGAEQDESDNGSVTSDSQRPKKKKKGQRFFCTDFPPCNLSFTRSEHLARHIRKHTGERPFQCHCNRRFSRLDNLRQHAQTVHVNEEIPGDSLAATGTRFQRQIRTDRVRPPNSRSRASTTASGGSLGHSHSRGHARNLSASSVASTASNVSSVLDEPVRRRPAPLAMAQDGAPRSRLSIDTFVPPGGGNGSPTQSYAYYQPQSPSEASTPTSATFSTTGQNSPRFAMQSPSSLSRSNFYNGSRPQARRLSVPSGSFFQPGQPAGYPPPLYYSALPSGAASSYSNMSSIMASPTSSVFSHGRRESDAELDWRRRTWHPGTYATYTQRPATSGLTYQQTPDDSRPTVAPQSAASQMTRLPGIESFDHAPAPPGAGPPRLSSPMQVDPANRPPVYPGPIESSATGPDDRRNNSVWEAGLHQNLNRLDLANNTPPKHGPSLLEQAAARPQYRPGHTHSASVPNFSHPHSLSGPPTQHAMAPPDADGRRDRRQGMYGGSVAGSLPPGSQPIMIAQPHRTSPDSGSSDGVPTPSTSQGRELHPAILHPNGMVEYQQPGAALTEEQQRAMQTQGYDKPGPVRADSGSHLYERTPPGMAPVAYVLQSGHEPRGYPSYPPPARPAHGMDRLDALVAVATSENAQDNS